MKDFSGISFNGTFRKYQQRVLDASKKYYRNNKIHIVAAPGSGKTILGLELISRLKSPCLVLSPTNTIKYQWGDRFIDFFLPKGELKEDYISFNLNDIKPLTSITYQALHSAMEKIGYEDEDDGFLDYSLIDMFELVNNYGIKTICVDEAHHLQNEWQKALEKFIKGLDKDIKIIALTATPPYDASPEEWKRYIEICGEIDEEIFVTELVKERNLCPHQDYIYFNYPTMEENEEFISYKKNVDFALDEVKSLDCVKEYIYNINEFCNKNLELKQKHSRQYLELITFFASLGAIVNKETIGNFSRKRALSKCTLDVAERSLDFFIKNVINKDGAEQVKDILKKYGLMHRGKICLELNDKLKQTLISSLGKLESIVNIVDCENRAMNKQLRMLILTDYIKKQSINTIGTSKKFNNISIVSIFESVRRKFPEISIGALSGGLVILPIKLYEDVKKLLGKNNAKVSLKELGDTGYAEYNLKINNKEKVSVVGKLFSEGKITILVGTKSLLGEGWDSPCINSLILASFVGSFMLSNQMRGRAIRIDKSKPNKTANIWHLVTLEPNYRGSNALFNNDSRDVESSIDYQTLCRRFNCFVGPKYIGSGIESGIERISSLLPQYTKESVDRINKDMCDRASNRQYLFTAWDIQNLGGEMNVCVYIPKDRVIPNLALKNFLSCFFGVLALFFSFFTIIKAFNIGITSALVCLMFMFGIIGTLVSSFMAVKCFIKWICHINFRMSCKSISRSVLNALKQLEKVSKYSFLKVKDDENKNGVNIFLITQSIREQNVFSNAMSELYSEITDNRYVIVKSGLFGLNYKFSFACPSVFGANRNNVNNFVSNLSKNLGRLKFYYLPNNRSIFNRCKNKSYISSESKTIKIKMKSS